MSENCKRPKGLFGYLVTSKFHILRDPEGPRNFDHQFFPVQADFRRINLEGTRHVLNTASKMGMVGVVFSSTTSLMNTLKVKEQTRLGVGLWLRSKPLVDAYTSQYLFWIIFAIHEHSLWEVPLANHSKPLK